MAKPYYESVTQCITFNGTNLPDVLRQLADYIEEEEASPDDGYTPSEGVLTYETEDGEHYLSAYYKYKHMKLKDCKKG